MGGDWQSIAARKQEQRQKRIPAEWTLAQIPKISSVLKVPQQCGLLSDNELNITENFDASALLEQLAAGRLKSVDVTTAFCKRAAIAQQLTNCLTEIFFEQGLARARQLDEHFLKHKKPVGPLHGLPISLKDTFHVEGHDASLGVAAFSFQPATSNSALVDLLLSLGAVLYCKTNIPQTLAALDSHNNIFGRVLNPANRNLTAGGSSGGEGALVAMRGSPLGIGTDVGASIRVPAMCNGLYGVKPSHGRVPYAGQQEANNGSSKIAIEPTAGPIARTMRDCAIFMSIIGNARPWLLDPDLLPQAWGQQISLHNRLPAPDNNSRPTLRVGIVRSDGHTSPLPPVGLVIDEVAKRLSSRAQSASTSVEIVELDITSLLSQCVKIFNGILSIDGGNSWFDLLEANGEPLSPWLQGRLRRRPAKGAADIVRLQARKTALQSESLKIWKESGGYWLDQPSFPATNPERLLDVIICPAAPHPVAPVDGWNTVNYTGAFNLLDYPAGILPIRPVTQEDLKLELPEQTPLNGWDKVNRELWTKIDRSVYLESMLSVQVVAPKLMDRKLVESMVLIDQVLHITKNQNPGPTSKL